MEYRNGGGRYSLDVPVDVSQTNGTVTSCSLIVLRFINDLYIICSWFFNCFLINYLGMRSCCLCVCVLSVKGTVSEVGLRGIVVQGELRARREKRPQGVR